MRYEILTETEAAEIDAPPARRPSRRDLLLQLEADHAAAKRRKREAEADAKAAIQAEIDALDDRHARVKAAPDRDAANAEYRT